MVIFADKICELGRKKIYEYSSIGDVNENFDNIVLKVHYFRQNRNVFKNAWGWDTNLGLRFNRKTIMKWVSEEIELETNESNLNDAENTRATATVSDGVIPEGITV